MALSEVERYLTQAIEAAEQLGLDSADARSAARLIGERQGYPSDLYVLALAGGTGVGKSSLLNALAGEEISPPGPRRPTTRSPIAMLPTAKLDEARALLEWLGGADIRTSPTDGPAIAIVDLPDLDSIEATHAARVDTVLPRVDAVLWVTDPEKYQDAVLHDAYLRRWMPRLARQAIVINKADRLSADDSGRVAADLRARLALEGLPPVALLSASALRDVEPVRRWLAEGASAKAIVSARAQRSAAEATRALASAGGVEIGAAPVPLVTEQRRAGAVSESRAAILDLVDLAGLRSQAAAASRDAARAAAGGPLGLLRSVVERVSGLRESRADPEGYLRRWRERGSLDRPIAPIRHLLLEAAEALPVATRARLFEGIEATSLSDRLARRVDGVISSPGLAYSQPGSRLWPLAAAGQLLATALVVAGVVWLVSLFASGGSVPAASFELPILGPMPTPAMLILSGLFAAFVLSRLLHWHAGRLGRRWADEAGLAISREVAAVLDDTLSQLVAGVDRSRQALWSAWRAIGDDGRTG
jgi:GTP-binding protein EngB required for normal cell division